MIFEDGFVEKELTAKNPMNSDKFGQVTDWVGSKEHSRPRCCYSDPALRYIDCVCQRSEPPIQVGVWTGVGGWIAKKIYNH